MKRRQQSKAGVQWRADPVRPSKTARLNVRMWSGAMVFANAQARWTTASSVPRWCAPYLASGVVSAIDDICDQVSHNTRLQVYPLLALARHSTNNHCTKTSPEELPRPRCFTLDPRKCCSDVPGCTWCPASPAERVGLPSCCEHILLAERRCLASCLISPGLGMFERMRWAGAAGCRLQAAAGSCVPGLNEGWPGRTGGQVEPHRPACLCLGFTTQEERGRAHARRSTTGTRARAAGACTANGTSPRLLSRPPLVLQAQTPSLQSMGVRPATRRL